MVTVPSRSERLTIRRNPCWVEPFGLTRGRLCCCCARTAGACISRNANARHEPSIVLSRSLGSVSDGCPNSVQESNRQFLYFISNLPRAIYVGESLNQGHMAHIPCLEPTCESCFDRLQIGSAFCRIRVLNLAPKSTPRVSRQDDFTLEVGAGLRQGFGGWLWWQEENGTGVGSGWRDEEGRQRGQEGGFGEMGRRWTHPGDDGVGQRQGIGSVRWERAWRRGRLHVAS